MNTSDDINITIIDDYKNQWHEYRQSGVAWFFQIYCILLSLSALSFCFYILSKKLKVITNYNLDKKK